MPEYQFLVCLSHTGKMKLMQSISTSVLQNKYCLLRSKDKKSICAKCYAKKQLSYQRGTRDRYARNTEVLTSSIIDIEKLPIINASFFRLEAFGDLNNVIQVINYFNICNKNPHTQFALWTKNPNFINVAIKNGNPKPHNLIIVGSSNCVNKVDEYTKFDFIDKIFTVYTKDYAKANNININCGAKQCITCLQCYLHNNVRYINELLK